MIESMKWPASAETRLVLFICLSVALVDFTVRVFPEVPSDEVSGTLGEAEIFGRLMPSKDWFAWYEGIKSEAEAEAEAKKLAEAKLAAAAQAEANTEVPRKDEQKGDLLRVRIGAITYQLWGVFNKVDKASGNDEFGVLKSEDTTVQVRMGDVIGGYRVTAVDTRSVTFASTVDERVVTLWLFGKGPR